MNSSFHCKHKAYNETENALFYDCLHQTLVAMHLSFFFEPGLSILDDVNVFLSLVTWIYPITVILTLVSFLKVNKHLLY